MEIKLFESITSNKLLVLPIELKQRELDTKMYIALRALALGWDVIISDLYSPVMSSIKGGTILYKDHSVNSETYLRHLERRGVSIFCHDEEGLIVGDPDLYISSRISRNILDYCKGVFVWGDFTREFFPIEYTDKIFSTGSPKFDFARDFLANMKGDKENEKGSKRVLINTRFSFNNGIFDGSSVERLIELGVIRNEKEYPDFLKLNDNEKIIFDEFIKLVKLLSMDFRFEVVIRPHPSEREAVWKALQVENVKVSRDVDLREQIDWADVVIHDGCTTAIEARFIGKLVLGLRPVLTPPAFDDFANQFSLNFTSARDIHSALQNDLKELSELQPDNEASYLHLISNWRSDVDSVEMMLSKMDASPPCVLRLGFHLVFNSKAIKIWLWKIVNKNSLSDWLPARMRKSFLQWLLLKEKFPDTEISEVDSRLKLLKKNLDSNLNTEVLELGENTWLFRSL